MPKQRFIQLIDSKGRRVFAPAHGLAHYRHPKVQALATRLALAKKNANQQPSQLNWKQRQNLIRLSKMTKHQRLALASQQSFIAKRRAFQRLPKLNRQIIALRQKMMRFPPSDPRERAYLQSQYDWKWKKFKYG